MKTKELRKCNVRHIEGIGRNSKIKQYNGYFHKWIERKDDDGDYYTVGIVEIATTGEMKTFPMYAIDFFDY